MGLRLRTVAPLQGSQWLRWGLRTFFRSPLAFGALFLGYLVLASLVGWIPFVGRVLSLATMPLLSLAFMLATRDVLDGRPPRLHHLIALWREPPPQRRTMLLLCIGYGLVMALVIELAVWWSGDALVAAMKPLSKDEPLSAQELMGVLGDPAVTGFAHMLTLMAAIISVPYWHALALVHWGGQSAGQALFSSTLALWRSKGAFLVFGLGWLGGAMATSLLAGIGSGLLGAVTGSGALAVAFGATLVVSLSAAFYVSLWFMFADSFVDDEAPAERIGLA